MLPREAEIEIYQVNHVPIVKAYADRIGLVEVVNQLVPTRMEVDAGTVVLGLVLDTLSGRSPLYRLEEFFEHQDMELLLGKRWPAEALNDDAVGRVLDRLYEGQRMKIFSQCAVRASRVFGLETDRVHFDTTGRSVYGDYQAEANDDDEETLTISYGHSKEKRPDVKQFVMSLLCVDRAVPIFGKLENGNASDKQVNNELLSQISKIMARQGVETGSYIYIADAALVTERNLAALGDDPMIRRLPASYKECERVIGEAVPADQWQDIGVIAQTRPTTNRPATFYRATESQVRLYGQSYRAVVVHSSAQDQRRLKRLQRQVQAWEQELTAQVEAQSQREYFCRADAQAAAERVGAMETAYHRLQVQDRPKYGPGRPSRHNPRPVKQMKYGLEVVIKPKQDRIEQQREAAGCFVLLTTVPNQGELAHQAGEIVRAYKEQPGVERNFSFLKDPVIVNSLFLKKPGRIEALGLILLLALLIWRLMERSLRQHVETTGRPLPGWDKKLTQRPTSFMMTTKFVGLMVLKREGHRQLARPLTLAERSLFIFAFCPLPFAFTIRVIKLI